MSIKRGGSNRNSGQLGLAFARRGMLGDALEAAAFQLSKIIRQSNLSRDQLCDRLSQELGRPVAKPSLDAWLAPSNDNRIPADVFVAILAILNDFSPLDELLSPTGRKVADQREQAYAEVGHCEHEQQQLDARRSEAWRRIKGGQ